LKNNEFTFTTDVSNLPCGLNGALYFVEMEENGGKSKHTIAKPGAQYGMGYCEAQCPRDMKFINGEETNENSGNGHYGTCCTEMDCWEANSQANADAPQFCSVTGQHECE
jgi:cellulose 1,4-beta-cellobiosidase